MASLKFYGGVGEIGGNKFLLHDKSTSLFLDFGKNFHQEKKYYDHPYLAPRSVDHLLGLGILPDIKGLYKNSTHESSIDGILLSHPHTDHTDYIRFLKDDIPIFCGNITQAIIIAREFCGRTAPSKEYYIANCTKTRGKEVMKAFQNFKEGRSISFRDLEITWYPVDHSTLGAFGTIIRTSSGSVVYTGDFRMHGSRSELTSHFIEQAKNITPIALLIEGTNIVEAKISSEEDVERRLNQAISHASQLVMAGFSIVDLDRLQTFYNVALKNNRKFAISMKQAYMIDMLQSAGEKIPLDLNSSDICIFRRDKSRIDAWEEELLSKYNNIIKALDITPIQDQLLLVASFYDMNEIITIQPKPGSIYILSQSEPFDEEMEIDFEKLLNWLERYGVPLYQIHASGHCSPHELKNAITKIAPEKVFLIHTNRPKLYSRYIEDLDIEIINPTYEKEYPL